MPGSWISLSLLPFQRGKGAGSRCQSGALVVPALSTLGSNQPDLEPIVLAILTRWRAYACGWRKLP